MARIRTIKPEFWTDPFLVQLPHLARLLYIALWSVADDHGYIKDEPERIALEVMPRERWHDIDAIIQVFVAAGKLDSYAAPDSGGTYLRLAKWETHQRVDKPSKSRVAREGSRKFAIRQEARRAVATKYGCPPGGQVEANCFYCGELGSVYWFRLYDGRPSGWVVFPGLEIDHLEPESEGGSGEALNLVLACQRCNRSKGTAHWLSALADGHGYGRSRPFAIARDISGTEVEVEVEVEVERKGKEVEVPRAHDGGVMFTAAHHQAAFRHFLAAAKVPDSLIRTLVALGEGMDDGRPVPWETIGAALADMAANGSGFSSLRLRTFVSRLQAGAHHLGAGKSAVELLDEREAAAR